MAIELRDHFAAHAIAALIPAHEDLCSIGIVSGAAAEAGQAKAIGDAAKLAYAIADAMIAARSAGESIYEKPGNLAL